MDGLLIGLIVWGVVVGLDLITGPQIMIARPIVAAPVAGWFLGDPAAGATVGVIMEMFALEILPFGAARYPDYGIGAVVATLVAADAPRVFGLGLAVFVGLGVAVVGERGIQMVRRLNSDDTERHRIALDRGVRSAIVGLHLRSIVRDAVRALVLTGGGLLLGVGLRNLPPLPVEMAVGATAVAVGVAAASVFNSGLRLAGGGRRFHQWFAAGVIGGIAWLVLA